MVTKVSQYCINQGKQLIEGVFSKSNSWTTVIIIPKIIINNNGNSGLFPFEKMFTYEFFPFINENVWKSVTVRFYPTIQEVGSRAVQN